MKDVATRTPGPSHRPARHGSTVDRWAAKRLLYLDNLKVFLIAGIIFGHGLQSYASFEFWPYSEMREVALSPVTETLLLAVVGPVGLLMIPLLFLVAGLFTPGSLERKGPGPFARDRLLRLGVPFAVFVLVLWPLLMYPIHPPEEPSAPYWTEFVQGDQTTLDTGPLWFVGVLLVFSLSYACWVWLRRGHVARPWRGEIGVRHLLLLAAAVAVATFLVRLVFPFDTENSYLDLDLWRWPGCLTLFALGIVASRKGWLTGVPDVLRRRSMVVTVAAVVAFGVFTAAGAVLGVVGEETWEGGWTWDAFVFPALESVLSVFGPVWLLGAAQRHLERRFRWAGPAVSRSAYGAFVLQGLALIGLAFLLRPVPLPAEVKALLVAGGGVAGSFALAWLLVSRVPGLARVF